MLADLAREIATVAGADAGWAISRKKLRRAMPMLADFVEHAFVEPAEDQAAARRTIEVLAWLDLLARGSARWWEWLPPLPWLRAGRLARAIVREAIAKVGRRAAGSEEAARNVEKAIATRRAEIRGAWGDAAKVERAADLVDRQLAARFGDRRLVFDAQELERRVMRAERFDALRDKERARRERAAGTTTAAAAARASFLRAESCEDLLARARVRVADTPAARVEERERPPEHAAAQPFELAALLEKRAP